MNGWKLMGLWALTGILTACIGGWEHLHAWLRDNEELAAWVQAVGSIVAIAAVGWSVRRAHDLQVLRHAQAEFDGYTNYVDSVAELVGGVASVSDKLLDHINGRQSVDVSDLARARTEMEVFSGALATIDVSRLRGFKAVQAVLVTRTALAHFIAILTRMTNRGWDGGKVPPELFDDELRDLVATVEPHAKEVHRIWNARKLARPT